MKTQSVLALALLSGASATALRSTDPTPACCNSCTSPNVKYYSIDHIFNQCGESCIPPSKFWLYHIFEAGLTLADSNTPCKDKKYSEYRKTETHGFGPVSVVVDMYGPDAVPSEVVPAVEPVVEVTEPMDSTTPCCQVCSDPTTEKFYSIDTTHNMCGEACMKPYLYNLYHIFESGLAKATSNTPCHDKGFSGYSSTVTHGFGPVKITLDLYSPDKKNTITLPELYNSFVAAGPSFSTCNGVTVGDFKITDIEVTPTFPIKRGNAFQIVTSGSTTGTYTGLSVKVTVKIAGVSVFSTTKPIAGTISGTWNYPSESETIPSIAPAGSYNVEVSYLDSSNKQLNCVDVVLQVV